MPTRVLREGILSSEPINRLSERAELFYRRLQSVADDYGRYWASPLILLTNCYPLRLETVTEADVKAFLSECIKEQLITLYGDGKYLLIEKFGQQTRSKSKFPQPTENTTLIKYKSIDKQMSITVGVEGVVEDEVVVVAENGIEKFNKVEQRLRVMFLRQPGTAMAYSEQSGISEVCRRETALTELDELEDFSKKDGSYFPKSMSRLLANWTETLDRARNFKPNENANHRPTAPDRNAGTYNANPSPARSKKLR